MTITVDLLSRTEAGSPITAAEFDGIIEEIEATFAVAVHHDTQVIAGTGLSGTGALSGNVTLDLADMAQATVKGRASGAGTGAPVDLTAAQLIDVLETADGTGSGLDADLLDGAEGSAYLLKTGLAAGTISAAPAAFNLSGGSTGHVLTKQANGDIQLQAQSGGGDMSAATYDPQAIAGDAFARANHTGTQLIGTISDFVITGPVANNEVLAWDEGSGKWINQTATEAGVATATQGSLADSALQLDDVALSLVPRSGNGIDLSGGTDGDVLTVQSDGSAAFETPGAHTHVVANITDAGVLAALDTVGTTEIDDDAVTDAKLSDTGVTGGSYTNATVTVNDQGRITDISSGSPSGGLSTVTDSNTAITLGDAVNGTHRRLTGGSAITLTLDAQGTVGTRVAVTPKGVGLVGAVVESGATYMLPNDSGTRTAGFGVRGYCYFEVVANSDSNSAVWDVIGETDHTDLADNAINYNGNIVSGNLGLVETDTGALTADQSGEIIKTSGNVTIPTTAGFNVTLIAGGAHTVTFNGTTSAAMGAGDVMSIVVESSTVIHAVLTASANKVAFS